MHEEYFFISDKNADLIEAALDENRRIIAVGTTTLRTIESAVSGGSVKRGGQSTGIFIRPGYQFKAVDALFTNFHTPRSTLLVLVSAFAGRENILDSYSEAITKGYRFFSYGDAMLII
jgi:S-adenosylmethionine:tRNA ribosyltransferase-isomerase